MLAANLNSIVEEGRIALNSIVHLKKFTCSLVKDRKILIVLDIIPEKIINLEAKIGNPINIEELLSEKVPQTTTSTTTNLEQIQSTSVAQNLGGSSTFQTTPYTTHVPSILTNTSSSMPIKPHPNTNLSSNSTTFPANVSYVQSRPLETNTLTNNFSGSENSEYTPIASLSPYNNRWTIKARCITKQDIRVFTNARGQGKVFSISLMDASGEIRATAFNDAVTQFFPLFEVGRVYSISKGQVKIAKRGFGGSTSTGAIMSNPYDMSLEKDTIVKPISGMDASSVPTLTYLIIPLINLAECSKDSIVDVLGVITEVHPISSIVVKATGKQLTRRDLTIVDSSNCSIRVTLWGKQAEDADGPDWNSEPVLAIKGAKVSDWGGRTLNIIGSTQLSLQPMDLDSALTLRGWYDTVGSTIAKSSTIRNLSSTGGSNNGSSEDPQMASSFSTNNFTPISERKTFSQIREDQHFEKVILIESYSYFLLGTFLFF